MTSLELKRIKQGIKSYYGIKSLRTINDVFFSNSLMIDKIKNFKYSEVNGSGTMLFVIRHNGLTIYSGKA